MPAVALSVPWRCAHSKSEEKRPELDYEADASQRRPCPRKSTALRGKRALGLRVLDSTHDVEVGYWRGAARHVVIANPTV